MTFNLIYDFHHILTSVDADGSALQYPYTECPCKMVMCASDFAAFMNHLYTEMTHLYEGCSNKVCCIKINVSH